MSLTANQRLHFMEMLRRAREQSLITLEETNADLAGRNQARSRSAMNEAAVIELEIDKLIAEQESMTLDAIDRALGVLREIPDLYGLCEECGEQIALARLNIAPWTTRCDQHVDDPTP